MKQGKVKPACGIVMPISAIDGCVESHWADVLDVLTEAIEDAGFEGNLVSNADDVGIIHKRIIQNLYDNPIVVCDVSGKNPNVMFELGLRLAFDKPTVIVKDDKTSYSFDTSAIEHIEYPRDLRFSKIVDFKQKLAEKLAATHARATSDPQYTTFLKYFGEFTVAKLDKKEVSGQEFILEELRSLRMEMHRLGFTTSNPISGEENHSLRSAVRPAADINICMREWSQDLVDDVVNKAEQHPDVINVRLWERGLDHKHILADLKPGANAQVVKADLAPRARNLRRLVKRNA